MVAFGSLSSAPASLSAAKASSLTISVPSGTTDGDFLLMVVTNSNPEPWNKPSGWTALVNPSGSVPGVSGSYPGSTADAGNDDNYSSAFYRIASSEPSSYTVAMSTGTSIMCGVMARYTGTSGLRAAAYTPTSNGSRAVSTSPSPAAIPGTMASDDLAIICYTYATDSQFASATLSGPTSGGWTNRITYGPTTKVGSTNEYLSGLILVDKVAGTDTPTVSASQTGGFGIFSLALINAPSTPTNSTYPLNVAMRRSSLF